MFAARPDHTQVFLRMNGSRGIILQDLSVPKNAVERRAQFMADIRKKDALGAAGCLSGAARVLRRLFRSP